MASLPDQSDRRQSGAEPTVEDLGFADLDIQTAYAVWRLRQQVFIIEQACPYPDLDGRDLEPTTRHLVLRQGAGVIGYLRVLDDGDVLRIGRVVLATPARGRGLGEVLMRGGVAACGGREIVLDAQSPLVCWYRTYGFEPEGTEFLEDGIPHTTMRRVAVNRG